MNKMEIVPRIRIDGKYYTFDELPEEKVDEIIEQRVNLAMAGIHYERYMIMQTEETLLSDLK